VASVTGIGVDDQFTVFGAGGALVFMLLSGLLLARFTAARSQGGVTDAVDHGMGDPDIPHTYTFMRRPDQR
jgi:hypothetical protein